MTIEPYALGNSRPLALPAFRTEPNLLERFYPLSAPKHADLHFGKVKPVLHFRSDMFRASRAAALSSNTPIPTIRKDTTLHDLHAALERLWPRTVSDDSHRREFFGTTTRLDIFKSVAARGFLESRAAIAPSPARLPLFHVSSPRPPIPDAQSSMVIERVIHLLGQQRIRDARRTLGIGSICYPANREIASLLRAISPGRVSPTGWTSPGRERETAWIKQNGHKYRGKWIALDEDRLITVGATLGELLANLDKPTERGKPPFIQKLMSE